jgi:hypothetical protein
LGASVRASGVHEEDLVELVTFVVGSEDEPRAVRRPRDVTHGPVGEVGELDGVVASDLLAPKV